jgi:hypothetical protein
MAVTRPKPMTVAKPGLSRRARRTLVWLLSVYSVLYFATWVGAYNHRKMWASSGRNNGCGQLKVQIELASCVPIVPGILLAVPCYSDQSDWYLWEGKLVYYDGFGCWELVSLDTLDPLR